MNYTMYINEDYKFEYLVHCDPMSVNFFEQFFILVQTIRLFGL